MYLCVLLSAVSVYDNRNKLQNQINTRAISMQCDTLNRKSFKSRI